MAGSMQKALSSKALIVYIIIYFPEDIITNKLNKYYKQPHACFKFSLWAIILNKFW